jgi:cold shock CspA family protein
MATGVVTEFDEAKGYGTIVADTGSSHFVHCTALADGSRIVDAGTPVRFVVRAGRRGQWEAAEVEKLN